MLECHPTSFQPCTHPLPEFCDLWAQPLGLKETLSPWLGVHPSPSLLGGGPGHVCSGPAAPLESAVAAPST